MTDQIPDPIAALRAAFADAGQEIASAMVKAANAMHAQTALRHLLNGDETAARETLTKVPTNDLWAIADAARSLGNLACTTFGDRLQGQPSADEDKQP